MKLPPLLCPSLAIVDQSWTRNHDELRMIGVALGSIADLVSNDRAHLVMTLDFIDIFEKFDFQRTGPYPLLTDIHRHIALWFEQQRGVYFPACDGAPQHAHPAPAAAAGGQAAVWCAEVAKLLALHDNCCHGAEYFVGIACHRGFSGSDPVGYTNAPARAFPVVGSQSYTNLAAGFVWDIPEDLLKKSVSFAAAKNNVHLLGGKVVKAQGTSHYSVQFVGTRTWTLDKNHDPVLDDHLHELVPITGLPYEFVKATLLTGARPNYARLRLEPHRKVLFAS